MAASGGWGIPPAPPESPEPAPTAVSRGASTDGLGDSDNDMLAELMGDMFGDMPTQSHQPGLLEPAHDAVAAAAADMPDLQPSHVQTVAISGSTAGSGSGPPRRKFRRLLPNTFDSMLEPAAFVEAATASWQAATPAAPMPQSHSLAFDPVDDSLIPKTRIGTKTSAAGSPKGLFVLRNTSSSDIDPSLTPKIDLDREPGTWDHKLCEVTYSVRQQVLSTKVLRKKVGHESLFTGIDTDKLGYQALFIRKSIQRTCDSHFSCHEQSMSRTQSVTIGCSEPEGSIISKTERHCFSLLVFICDIALLDASDDDRGALAHMLGASRQDSVEELRGHSISYDMMR